MAHDKPWMKIFEDFKILEHDFGTRPYILTAEKIKLACSGFKKTSEKEVRILCKQDSREDRPLIFKDNDLFILPKKNRPGEFYILKGEGYIDIPDITSPIQTYNKKINFELKSSTVGDSEMQYLDFAYANSLIRTFMSDPSLVLTIRGRKYTPEFSFHVGNNELFVRSVQTEVDAGYEGEKSIVLVEAKNQETKNTIIRQLYYPYRQWSIETNKIVYTVFFEKRKIRKENIFYLWLYQFDDLYDYNSIKLVRAQRYRIV